MADVWANSMACQPRATCHVAGWAYCHLINSLSWSQTHMPMSLSCHIAGCKNSIRHIENRFSPYFIFLVFLMQFGLWRAAAFVSFPIHLFETQCICYSQCLHVGDVNADVTDLWTVQTWSVSRSVFCRSCSRREYIQTGKIPRVDRQDSDDDTQAQPTSRDNDNAAV